MGKADSIVALFDVAVAGPETELSGAVREFVVRRADEVVDVPDPAQQRSEQGSWALGVVTCDAPSGFDKDLATLTAKPNLLLVSFGFSSTLRTMNSMVPITAKNSTCGAWLPGCDIHTDRRTIEIIVIHHIAREEGYQCNVTSLLATQLEADTIYQYGDLALKQRARYKAHIDLGQHSTVGASHKFIFEFDGMRIAVRPMNGAAPRGRTTSEDARTVEQLAANDKERAANPMIVDPPHNDLARTASIRVSNIFQPERCETVHQLTSEFIAAVEPTNQVSNIFSALFPYGPITGAPKQRTTNLIAESEERPLGVHCGAIGAMTPPSDTPRAWFSMATRAVVVDGVNTSAGYGSSGAVTWGSTAAAEHSELLLKARVLDEGTVPFYLFETMRHTGEGCIKSLTAHLTRMKNSAAYFSFEFNESEVRSSLATALTKSPGASRVRLSLYHNGTVEIAIENLPRDQSNSLRLALHAEPIDTTTCWSRHKTSQRDPYTKRLAALPDFDDVVLQNERGEIMETCTGNIALRLDNAWITPELRSGCLPGIERQRLVNAGVLGERTIKMIDLRRGTDLAVISSLRGWRTAVLIALRRNVRRSDCDPARSRRSALS